MSEWEIQKALIEAVTTIHRIEHFTLSHCNGCYADDCDLCSTFNECMEETLRRMSNDRLREGQHNEYCF